MVKLFPFPEFKEETNGFVISKLADREVVSGTNVGLHGRDEFVRGFSTILFPQGKEPLFLAVKNENIDCDRDFTNR